MIKKRLFLTLTSLLLLVTSAKATCEGEADETGMCAVSTLVGVGSSNQLDTYLSPMEYTGTQLTFLTSRERMTRMAGGHIAFQSMLQGAFSRTSNPANTGRDWGGHLAYDAGWHYQWHVLPHLMLKAGGLVGADVGLLYNERNGNNPAQGRASMDVSASAGGSYQFRIGKFPMQLRYQADLPVLGVLFSPQFGQSYYELSLGHTDHNVCCSHFGNALNFRQLLTLDLEFKRASLRLGYMNDVRQSHVNHIKTHDISHNFMIGYVRYLRRVNRDER